MSNEKKAALPASLLVYSRKNPDDTRRRDQVSVKPELLEVEEGFNVRSVGIGEEAYWSQDHVIEHVNNLAFSYANGDYVPPIVVKFDKAKQKALIRDGHHRYKALMQAIADGNDIKMVNVTEIRGDERNDVMLMLQSANNMELTPVSKAEAYHRLVAYGYTVAEIAKKINKSVSHVQQLLKVYDLPLSKKKALQLGTLSIAKALADGTERKPQPQHIKRQKDATKSVLATLKDIAIPEPDADGLVAVKLPYELLLDLQQRGVIETDENQLSLIDGEDQ